jgi:hypothetical protein
MNSRYRPIAAGRELAKRTFGGSVVRKRYVLNVRYERRDTVGEAPWHVRPMEESGSTAQPMK